MSVNIGYFFNRDAGLTDVARELHAWLGCDLQSYANDPNDLYCRFLGMELSLRAHNLISDGELDFEKYHYELDLRTPAPDADLRPLQLMTMTSLVYAGYRRLKITGMLVFDVQTLLARYEARSSEGSPRLFDVVSDRYVAFPEHWRDLARRL